MENDTSSDVNTFENITVEFVNENVEECTCDKNDPTIEHGPVCPGAPRPDLSNNVIPCVNNETPVSNKIPSLIFIIPYRDREQQMLFFKRQMAYVLEDYDKDDYSIYFVHQTDKREFNRGAMKNIGFLAVWDMYPNDYKNITLVFNDVDTMPYSKNFLDYKTTTGIVKHFYGHRHVLGGIVSITAGDFIKIRGFPNFWAWGYEDNLLQKRVLHYGLRIDRSQFYNIMDKNIMHLFDGLERIVNKTEFDNYIRNTTEGWHSISNLKYTLNESNGFIDVETFDTQRVVNTSENKVHDLRKGNRPFPGNYSNRRPARMGMIV
jgi:hypothetical protein